MNAKEKRVAFIGSAGVPNRHGGFESFLEHCGPVIAGSASVIVTCDSSLYPEKSTDFRSLQRVFIPVPANGAMSIVHDLFAFLAVFWRADAVVVLGVSGAPWFPLFRALCWVRQVRLVVNIDGVEWRRSKYSRLGRLLLRAFDACAQVFANRVVYDNVALESFVLSSCREKAVWIPYSGDHVVRLAGEVVREPRTALTVCRIEPENNIEMLIAGALASSLSRFVIVGNWGASAYGRELRARFVDHPMLVCLDPVYEAQELASLRESCAVYLHGHQVGGTNPSLVEMMFYDCDILCFECAFNRHTAGGRARYFSNDRELTIAIDLGPIRFEPAELGKYTAERIAELYLHVCSEG